MKTLVVIGHPDLETSLINKRWMDELKKYPENFTVHHLRHENTDHRFDLKKEQKLIEEHGNLIIQFPMYWFNCPALVKQWIDEVFTEGWAYGEGGTILKEKKIGLGISMGLKEEKLTKYNFSVDDLILPFKITFSYTKSNFRGFYALYNSHEAINNGELDKSIDPYLSFIKNI